jgi:N-methylhydantoinase B
LEIESAFSIADFSVLATLERTSNPAAGRHGGFPGALASLRRSDGSHVHAMGVHHVPAGVRLLIDTAGGGGFGRPEERDRKRLRQDVLEGLVTLEDARQKYGATIAELEIK